MGLVRSTLYFVLCHYCLGGCSALVVCVQRSWQVCLGEGRAGSLSPPPCVSLFPRAPRCVSRVVLSRCPFPSPAGTPCHAVCAVGEPGLVALRVRAAFLLCVCVLVHPRCTLPPLVGVARATRAVPAKSAGRAVRSGFCPSAFPHPVPCSAFLARGGGDAGPASSSPCLALGRLSPWQQACVPGAVQVRGGVGGDRRGGIWGQGPPVAPPGGVAGPGPVGGASVIGAGEPLVRPSASPARAPRLVFSASLRPWRAQPPYHSALCLCASARAPPGGGRSGGPGAPAGDRWARLAGLVLRYPSGGGRHRPAGLRLAASGGYRGSGGGVTVRER